MASYQQLQDDVAGWLNRKAIGGRIAGWVAMTETDIAETVRARCMVRTTTQAIDSAYITLPPDFATMASIRDATTGEMLVLKDEWSGHWHNATIPSPTNVYGQILNGPATAYRLVHDCIEFLPHPIIPDPPDPTWRPQGIMMGYYATPKPLLLPSDTNAILDTLYGVYFWGVCKYGAMFELDDDRAAQCDAAWQQAVTRANLAKQQSDLSGAPLRAELAVHF